MSKSTRGPAVRRPHQWLLPAELAANLSTPMKVYLGFGLALLILAIVALVAKLVTDRLVDSVELQAESYEVLAQGTQVVASLRAAEASHRGYVLTGEDDFLASYDSAASTLLVAIRRLESARGSASEQERLTELSTAVAERLAFLSAANALRTAGDIEAAQQAVLAGGSSELRARINRLVADLSTEEQTRLEQRANDVDRTLEWARWVNVGGVLLSILLMLFATYLINGDLRTRRRAQTVLIESERALQDFLDSAGDLIQSASVDGRIEYVNQRWLSALGYDMDEVIGRNALDFVAPEYVPSIRAIAEPLMTGALVPVSLAYMTRTGQRLHVEGTGNSRMVDGEPVSIRVILRDVTAQREVERMKDEFISVVSHELRTPLTSIRGALGLLAGGLLGALPDRGRRMLDVATQNTDRLIRLINDVLDVERINSGKAPMVMQRMSLREAITEMEGVVRPLAERADIQLDLADTDVEVQGDVDRIVQLLTNLFSNAIKFSPAHTRVQLKVEPAGDAVHLRVIDEGRGIPVDKLETVFERFHQIDASDARDKGGSGLGLAICRSIAEQHGGRVWAESDGSAGSTFHVLLPAIPTAGPDTSPGASRETTGAVPRTSDPFPETAAAATAGADAVDSAKTVSTASGPTILVCGEDEAARAALDRILSDRGYRVISCATSEEAVKVAAAEHPAVIVLDLAIPGPKGYRPVAELKASEATRSIPVLIVSSGPDVDGIVIPRPAEAEILAREVERAIQHRGSKQCILIVEDDDDLAKVLKYLFESKGLRTAHARNGREAIELSQAERPALLLLDLMMPETDGFAVVDWLRRHGELKDVPIVVYTARDLDAADRVRLDLAPDRLLTKSRIPPDDLAERVAGFIGRITAGSDQEGRDEDDPADRG